LIDVESESEVGKKVTAQCGESRPMYLLLAGSDTVPISVCRDGGMRSTECHLIPSVSA